MRYRKENQQNKDVIPRALIGLKNNSIIYTYTEISKHIAYTKYTDS